MVLLVVVVASLAALVTYGLLFACAATVTAVRRERCDPLRRELDRFLDEALRQPTGKQ